MAEFLIRVQNYDWDVATVSALDSDGLRSYNARSRKGDIIVVRPDGHKWGTAECLPEFVVVKVVNVLYDTVSYLENQLWSNDTKPKLLKNRRFHVPDNVVDTWVSAGKSIIEIKATPQQQLLLNGILEKLS